MNAKRITEANDAGFGLSQQSCSACPAYELNLCQAASAAPWAIVRPKSIHISQSDHAVLARRIIWREEDVHDAVTIICTGWAASIIMLPNSRRQILSFLLPGDIISTAALFDPTARCRVEAITDVRYRTFNRAQLKAIIFKRSTLLERILRAWIDENARADKLIVDLGCRSADERVANMVLNLVERLAIRNMAHGDPLNVEFPLIQRHIADATGLTPVHVNKVLSKFRREGLIEFRGSSLTILNLTEFRRAANFR